ARVGHPARCAFDAEVVSMPLRRGVLHADLRARELSCEDDDVRFAEPMLVRIHALPDEIARGDHVSVVAQLAPVRTNLNPDLGDGFAAARKAIVLSGTATDVTVRARAGGVAASNDRARAALRRSIDRVLPASFSAIARALVLGEEDLD